jgi:hypothetical protein
MGGNSDGSLGVYGGKRYEGLGVRDVTIRIFSNSLILGGRKAKPTIKT